MQEDRVGGLCVIELIYGGGNAIELKDIGERVLLSCERDRAARKM